MIELKLWTSELKHLQVVQKVPKEDRIDQKAFLSQVKKVLDRDAREGKNKVRIPNHLLCPLNREMYHDAVMIESGMTYERSIIEKYFRTCSERAKEAEEEDSSDFSASHFFICPIKRVQVNPEILQPNKRIMRAVEDFRRDHPDADNLAPKKFPKRLLDTNT